MQLRPAVPSWHHVSTRLTSSSRHLISAPSAVGCLPLLLRLLRSRRARPLQQACEDAAAQLRL
jgi:hypothetical protein